MRAVYINLDRATERRAFMERQAPALGLVLERRSAVSSADIPAETIAAIGRSWERPLTPAEIGCFLSHRAIWAEVAEGGKPVLVLEDDVVVSRRLIRLGGSMEQLAGTDFLNLESYDRRRFVGKESRSLDAETRIVRLHRDKSGSAAYVLWPAGAQKLLRRAKRGAAPVDAFLHGLKTMLSFQVEPALAMQVHLLAGRGFVVPISTQTFIQAPRGGLPWTLGHLPFHLRRVRTQLALAGEHLTRLGGRRYRRVDIDEADFAALLPRAQSRS